MNALERRWLKTKQLAVVVLVGFIVLNPMMWTNSDHKRKTKYIGFISFLFKNIWNSNSENIGVSIIGNTTSHDNTSFLYSDEEVREVVPSTSQNNQTVPNQILDYYTNNRELPITLSNDYLINNKDICSGSSVINVLVIVHSSIQNYQKRNDIRSTYGSKTLFLPSNIRVAFLMGRHSNRNTQAAIEDENMKYGDIVQGDFLDTYHNLTHKAVMGLRWVTEHCQNSEWTLKVDDDVVFDMEFFLELFASQINPNTIHCCTLKYPRVLRTGKWSVAPKEFHGRRKYPWSFCAGFATVFRSEIAKRLYNAAFVSPFFWIDDVYVYGILRNQAEIKLDEDFNSKIIMNKDYELLKNCILRELGKCQILAMCVQDKYFKSGFHLFTIRKLQREFLKLGQF